MSDDTMNNKDRVFKREQGTMQDSTIGEDIRLAGRSTMKKQSEAEGGDWM